MIESLNIPTLRAGDKCHAAPGLWG